MSNEPAPEQDDWREVAKKNGLTDQDIADLEKIFDGEELEPIPADVHLGMGDRFSLALLMTGAAMGVHTRGVPALLVGVDLKEGENHVYVDTSGFGKPAEVVLFLRELADALESAEEVAPDDRS